MSKLQNTPLSSEELNAETLKGADIYGIEGTIVGQVSHLHGSGAACQVIVDVGGFLGMGAKPVVIGLGQLEFMRDRGGRVYAVTGWSKAQLEAMPEHSD